MSLTESKSLLIPAAQDRPGDDPIFALNAEARGRAEAGESIVNATLGALMTDEGQLAVMPSVFEAFQKVSPSRAAAYAPIAGDPPFLKAVIRDLFAGSVFEDQAVAVATPGGTGAVHHALLNFLDPGQALLTTSYYWGPYGILADHTRRRVETFEMFDGGGRLNTAAFERELSAQLERQGRALVLFNSPCHNPTGYSLDRREWREVVRIVRAAAARAPVTLLLDHAYAKFGGPDANAWVEEVAELAGEAVLLVAWTVSKSFAQYGARIGALVAAHPDPGERKRLFNALSYSCRGTWSNCNHLGLLAVTELLTDPDLVRRSNAEREQLRALLARRVEVFNEHATRAGLSFPRYEGGFFVTVFCSDAEAAAAHMRERGVFVVPIAGGGLRVALCSTPAADVPRVVAALAEAVRATAARSKGN